MSDVVRLEGEDHEVVAVADAALRSIGPAHQEWMAAVRRLHSMRRELMRQLGAGTSSARPQPATTKPSALTPLWWTALAVGVAATITGSAPMLPPRHPQDPGLIMAIAPPAIALAAALLILAAILVPRAGRSATAVALGAMSGVFALGALAVNLFRGDALIDAGGPSGVAAWAIGATGVVVGSVVLVLRARPRGDRSSSDDAAAGKAWRSAATELRGDAKRLLRRAPSDPAAQARWRIEIERLAPELPAATIAQARELGPWTWLVWSAYDGEIDLPRR